MKKSYEFRIIIFTALILISALNENIIAQSLKNGIVVYQTRRTLQKSDFGPNAFLFSASRSASVFYSKTVFKDVQSVSYNSRNAKPLLDNLEDNYNISYQNSSKLITIENKTKLQKNYNLISHVSNNLLKTLTEQKQICGYTCTKIIFTDAEGNKNNGWVAKNLPASAGCVLVKNVTSAVLSFEGKRDTCIAIGLQPNIKLANSYLLPPKTKLEAIDDNKSLYASTERIQLNELESFPPISLRDLKKNIITNKVFQQKTVTAITFWNNIDMGEMFGSRMAVNPRDFELVKTLDALASEGKIDVQLLAVTIDNPDELKFTNPDVLKLKKTKVIPQALNWMRHINVLTYPTVILVDKAGIIMKIIHYTNGDDEFQDLKTDILAIEKNKYSQ